MLDEALLVEAQRELTICNACRYCEGVCAVFPALELRPAFAEDDVVFLANLCHDCRACYYVCPFSPPHEFALNFPKVMGEVREASYIELARPKAAAARFDRSPAASLAVVGATVLVVLAMALALSGAAALVTAHTGPRSFYEVIPWAALVIPFGLLAIGVLLVAARGAVQFWRLSARKLPATASHVVAAIGDAVTLRNMRGEACSYPGEDPTPGRWIGHTLLFGGYGAALLSTIIAAVAEELLGIEPPYPVFSPPVLLGIAGGISMIAGSVTLLRLKANTDRTLSHGSMRALDFGLLGASLAVSITGLLVLAARDTALMPLLLVLHLGFVAALFLSLPYGKLVHGVYRLLALARDRSDQA